MAQTGTVKPDGLNLRQAPGGTIIKVLPKGTIVEILEDTGDFLKVTASGDTGFVKESFIHLNFAQGGSSLPPGILDKIFDFSVEQREIPRPGGKKFFFNSHTQIGVLHTTENAAIESSFNALKGQFSAPHFIAGEGRIIQCRPITAQGSALRGDGPCFANAQAAIQIEMVGFTGGSLGSTDSWIPKEETLLPTAAIMAFCASNGIDIPLQVPNEDWKDDASDMPLPWAFGPPNKPKSTINRRRIAAAAGAFPALKGWWMHVEIPCQGPTWHHDCGRLRRREMIQMARDLLNG